MNSRSNSNNKPGRQDAKYNRDNETDRNKQDLPGYPHYPANEDITQPVNNNGEVEASEEYIMLPDVSDIPGQENITVPKLGDLADVTISSADEEDLVSGDSLDTASDEDDVEIVMGTEADVTAEDLQLLGDPDGDMDLGDDEDTVRDLLDKTDEDGDPLNEANAGTDLDVPGSEDDDANEDIGAEDEENNYYSLGSDDKDNITEGTP